MRTAGIADAGNILRWRNDPVIVSLSTQPRTIPWEEHLNWLQTALNSREHLIFVVSLAVQDIGVVRVHLIAPDLGRLSVYLAKDHTGKGYGQTAIQQAAQQAFARWPEMLTIEALVKESNTASIKAFSRTGFVASARADAHGHLVLRLSRLA